MMVHEMCVQALLMSVMQDTECEGLKAACICAALLSPEFMCQTNIHLVFGIVSRHLHKKYVS